MKILHIQHAAILGGSCVSSVLTLKGLQASGHKAIIALARPTESVISYYKNAGFDPILWPLACWKHSMVSRMRWWNPLDLLMGIKLLLGWRGTKRRTLKLVEATRPDVVHLNSMPLVASASALAEREVPFVWHVREPPPDQGWRTRVIRSIMRKAATLIFISEHDRQQWMGENRGELVRNFVDLKRFNPEVDGGAVREKMGLSDSQPVLLYAGGIAEIKGCFVLLEALAELKQSLPDLVCLMPGTMEISRPVGRVRMARRILPFFGMQTQTQRFDRMVQESGLQGVVHRLPFRNDMENLIAASDIMLFPATVPHFARPVIEAAAMAKPSIGSNLGGINELILHEKTGLLISPGSSKCLGRAITRLLANARERTEFGQVAHNLALRDFNADRQNRKMMTLFKKVRQIS